MKKIILLLATFLIFGSLYSQSLNKIIFDEKAENDILIGKCNRDGFSIDQFREWFDTEYDGYELDMEVLNKIESDKLNKLNFTIVMGTWCSDSRREIPRFYRILDEFNFDDDNINLICVNREKKAEDMDISELKIELVPTIIFYLDKKEIGRIIETPKQTLEIDLLEIMNTIQ